MSAPTVGALGDDADGRFSSRPTGAPQNGQCRVAALEKGSPFPADRASPKAPTFGALAVLRGSDITI
ncbi:MAG: hypothetical protein PVF82_11655 [Gammaproteobacteria bacterium]